MDTQNAINILAAGLAGGFGWLMREVWQAVKELRNDLSALREELPKDYVLKSDMENILQRIDGKLDKLFDRLDGKVDKA